MDLAIRTKTLTSSKKSKRVLDLAKELETDVVTTHHRRCAHGSVSHPRYQIMQDACGKLAEYADQMGGIAIETGPETGPPR